MTIDVGTCQRGIERSFCLPLGHGECIEVCAEEQGVRLDMVLHAGSSSRTLTNDEALFIGKNLIACVEARERFSEPLVRARSSFGGTNVRSAK